MNPDPIVEEVRRSRREIAANSEFDLRRIIAAAQKRQSASGHRVVAFDKAGGLVHTKPRLVTGI